MAISEIIASLSTNPYFGAGFGLVGIGSGIAILRKFLIVGTQVFQRNYLMSLEVPCRDRSYEWLLLWINRNTKNAQHLSVETTFNQMESGKVETKFDFVPSVGQHYFWYRGKLIFLERSRDQMLNLNTGVPWESVKLTTLGRNRQLYFDILDEARRDALATYEGKTVMYTAMGHEWREFGAPRKRRLLSSVILNGNISEKITKDVKEFIDSSDWYAERGIPYRRGYLLYGPPGCGKTSFITALAGELQFSICCLNLSERGLTDDRLNYLMNVTPQQSIVLLEDIDAAFVSREERKDVQLAYDGSSRLTFSGLLNMLDGVASSEARILFMTTNYLERLDPALIRPGRVDYKEYIGYASEEQIIKAFTRFYPQEDTEMAIQFKDRLLLETKQVSMAMLQGYFLLYKNNPKEALKNINQFRKRI
ncbi:mitochondrial chaperone BCS1 [Tetranychus urticae]|nr:mitochondrial chaperone BCS1 [Tetranychus urticae]